MINSGSLHGNHIIAPILLGIALLVGVVFLRPAYASYIENKSIISTLSADADKFKSEYDSLKAIKDNIGTTVSPERLERIQKLAKKYNNSEIMSTLMLNDYTKETIVVSSISVGKGKKLPNGLSLGTVSLTLQGKTIADIIDFITYITKGTEYIFTLDNISLPIDTKPEENIVGSYTLSVNLGIYYYE